MLTFEHGHGLSMQNSKEYSDIGKNGHLFNDLIDIAKDIAANTANIADTASTAENAGTAANAIVLEVSDQYLFDKLEQLINSHERTEISVVGNHIVANVSKFNKNTNPSTIRYNHFYQLYWYIRTALIRNLMFALVSNNKNAINVGNSKYIIRNPQSISIENGK